MIVAFSLSIRKKDETNSDFQKFIENDPVRPDLAGHYRAFFKLIIDAEKTVHNHIARDLLRDKTAEIIAY
jgi:hypothetical protein